MGLFGSKEIECTCLRCGRIWYTTKKEIRESKQLKREIKMAKFDNTWRFHTVRTHQNNAAKIAFAFIIKTPLLYNRNYSAYNYGIILPFCKVK